MQLPHSGLHLRLVYSEEEIEQAVQRLADRISDDYKGEEILLVVVLKGALFFAADLARKIELPLRFEFIRIASYCGTESAGKVSLLNDVSAAIEGQNVLIVEDIVDTGLSLDFLLESLTAKQPKSLRVCTLIDKAERRMKDVSPDYTGISCPGGFLVGYGLDFDGLCRQLPAIYELIQD